MLVQPMVKSAYGIVGQNIIDGHGGNVKLKELLEKMVLTIKRILNILF